MVGSWPVVLWHGGKEVSEGNFKVEISEGQVEKQPYKSVFEYTLAVLSLIGAVICYRNGDKWASLFLVANACLMLAVVYRFKSRRNK